MKTIIELVGLPATGKTSFLKKIIRDTRDKYNVRVLRDSSEKNPLQNKKDHIDFNIWNISKIISDLKEFENDLNQKILVIEKGIFDISAWLNWHKDFNNHYHQNTTSLVENLNEYYVSNYNYYVVFFVEELEVILQRREYGRIFNDEVMLQLKSSYLELLKKLKETKNIELIIVRNSDFGELDMLLRNILKS